MLVVSVADNGIGIKQKDQGKLFSLFGFIEETQEINTQGIGLGLHICQRIVREMGGDITCDSVWTKGSKFIFAVKLVQNIRWMNYADLQFSDSQLSVASMDISKPTNNLNLLGDVLKGKTQEKQVQSQKINANFSP